MHQKYLTLYNWKQSFLFVWAAIFSWLGCSANKYLPTKTFSFKPSAYPNKEGRAGNGPWQSPRISIAKNNTLLLPILIKSILITLIEVGGWFAYPSDQQGAELA